MKHEIAIIGAGPSGSTAAILLAQFGFDVCLIEKRSFPRDILCGEFLSHEVTENLKQLNLFNNFLLLKPNAINSFAMYDDKNEISTNLDFQAYGMKRSIFDNFLLTCAKERQVIIYQPCEVSEIVKVDGMYKLRLKSAVYPVQEIESKYVIAAYGKRNHLDAKLNRKFATHKSNLDGIKYHINKKFLRNVSDHQIQIYSVDGIYCGVNSVSNDEVTFCFLEDRRSQSRTPIQSMKHLAERNEKFKSLFSSRIEDAFLLNRVYGAGNICFGSRNKVENGIFMIGDAAQVIAPLAGDGISMAMDSAKLSSNLFNEKKKKNITDAELYNMYEIEWHRKFNRRLRISLFIQNVLFKKVGRRIGLGGLKFFPQALNYFIKTTRGRIN